MSIRKDLYLEEVEEKSRELEEQLKEKGFEADEYHDDFQTLYSLALRALNKLNTRDRLEVDNARVLLDHAINDYNYRLIEQKGK